MLFLLVLHALTLDKYFLSISFIKTHLGVFFFNYLMMGLSLYSCFKFLSTSKIILGLYLSGIFISSLSFQGYGFDKVLLIASFMYLFFAYYFYHLWELKVEASAFTPKFKENDLFIFERFNIDGTMLLNGQQVDVVLTSIDEKSCFVCLRSPLMEHVSILGTTQRLILYLDGVPFENDVKIVSVTSHGIGVFVKSVQKSSMYSIRSLYKICLERQIV